MDKIAERHRGTRKSKKTPQASGSDESEVVEALPIYTEDPFRTIVEVFPPAAETLLPFTYEKWLCEQVAHIGHRAASAWQPWQEGRSYVIVNLPNRRLPIEWGNFVRAEAREEPDETSADALVRLRVEAELHELEKLRFVRSASEDDGRTQRDIAELLGTSQTDVHRLLARSKRLAISTALSAREVILMGNAGRISRGTMLGRLSGMGLQDGRLAPVPGWDGYIAGSWDDVEDAFVEGLITDAEYEILENARKSEDPSDG